MRYSIRFKLFAALFSMIMFFIAVSWLMNSLFLEKFYLYNKEKMLNESYKSIVDQYNNTSADFLLELEKLENMKGLRIVIVDKEMSSLYDSNQRDINFRFRRHMLENADPAMRMIKDRLGKVMSGRTFVENWLDERINANFITLYSRLDDEIAIAISTPVSAIQESAGIANRFSLFTGMLTLVVGGIFIFFITSRFTRPILELNDIAQRMSVLDFNKRYKIRTHDEIGQLGGSINSLSEQLQKSISELQDANKKLIEDIEKEKKIDEMRKEFITNVSHELKTPIALIQGYAEGLKVNVNEDEESKDYYCDVIVDEALKMNRLVRDLLDLSQLESGKLSLDKTVFEISELAESVIKKNAIVIKDRNLDVEILKENEISVCADFERIEQVLMNYLNNAVNHVDAKKLIRVSIRQSGDKARISVFNSGANIPDESIDRIWLSFYKVDKARTRAYGGTGIGLSIVKAIQDAHENRCGVNNAADGVEFWFELDIAE